VKIRIQFRSILSLTLVLIGAALMVATQAVTPPSRPAGPCDIYGAAGTPCVAAHSTTRALSASYNGPLYQIKRQTDGKTLDIGVVRAVASPVPDPGGYADAAAQDAFCLNALCVISRIYDQSGKQNHLYQAPPGPQFPGPAKGAFDTQPIADMAPITISGHKAYGVYIMPGMGFRNNDATGLAIDDEPEGIYYVVDGTHYDSGCCFDYGNSSTNGRAVGTGTMETTYFGTATAWGSGNGPGPWIMADMEAGLFSGYNAKQNVANPTIDSWRFVTAVVDGGGGNKWDLRGGNAQKGGLTTFYSGIRPGSSSNNSYYPMHKQGGILLGTGGDNGNGSSGTFYEGVMTTGYPTEATTDAVQANIVAARYDVQRVGLSRITTFTPTSVQEVTATFTNTTGAPATGLKLSVSAPAGWAVVVAGGSGATTASATFNSPIAPGATVNAVFKVTSSATTGAGFLSGKAEWTSPNSNAKQSETTTARVRNVLPLKINEVAFSTGANPTNQFIELYNSSSGTIDLSNWTLIHTQSQWAPVKLATIPAGTRLMKGAYYLLGLSSSGLAAPVSARATVIHVRNTTGFSNGQKINVDGETRTITSLGSPATASTTVFIPVSTGPWITIPAGATNLPVTNTSGFVIGQKMGIDLGGNYELVTVTSVGKAATQTTLSAPAIAGSTNIKLAATANMTVGDILTIGTGGRKELSTIKSVGTTGANGTGVDLVTPLRIDHMTAADVSGRGTGIGFSPATKFAHTSGDAVQALGSGITLDSPLARSHPYGAPLSNPMDPAGGYEGPPPNQWFGGLLSTRAGSIALLDASGTVIVDAVVYGSQQSNSSANGSITSPELATLEGDQGRGGCIVVIPAVGGRGGGAPAGTAINRSSGRFPDGADKDSNCTDFLTQTTTTLAIPSSIGASNIKVANVAEFSPGQRILINTAANRETAVITAVGTAGATTTSTATAAGVTVIPVAGAAGFTAGQTIAIDTGANSETAVVVSTAGGGRGGGVSTITVASPLTLAHAVGVQVAGSGITVSAPLALAHPGGAQIVSDIPTPGAANNYFRKRAE
jgi:non-reducing end alpha-L-arabinofuranosidase